MMQGGPDHARKGHGSHSLKPKQDDHVPARRKPRIVKRRRARVNHPGHMAHSTDLRIGFAGAEPSKRPARHPQTCQRGLARTKVLVVRVMFRGNSNVAIPAHTTTV